MPIGRENRKTFIAILSTNIKENSVQNLNLKSTFHMSKDCYDRKIKKQPFNKNQKSENADWDPKIRP